jgi:hypothetical protein
MKGIIKRAWAQIFLAVTVALLLIAYKQAWPYADLVHHLGEALVVAAVVTAFWHLREVSEVINKYVRGILLDYDHLVTLETSVLRGLRSKAAKAILHNKCDNPSYRRDELEEWIDKLLYQGLLPGGTSSSGLYREDYVERIVVEYLTLDQALDSENLPKKGLNDAELRSHVMRLTTTTEFTVISPSLSNKSGYAAKNTADGCGLPNFPPQSLTRVRIGRDREHAKEVLTKTREDNQGQIFWETEPKTLSFENGKCNVWMEILEYRSPIREPFVLNTMGLLTRNLSVSIHQIGQGKPLLFLGQMIATPSDEGRETDTAPHVAWLKYDGWLFEDHGYHFHWFELPKHEKPNSKESHP